MFSEDQRRKRLQYRVAVALVVFGLVIVSIVATVSLVEFKKTLNYHLYAHLESVASVQKSRLETFLDRMNERADLIGSRTKLRKLLKAYSVTPSSDHIVAMNKILSDAKQSLVSIEEITIVGGNGVVVASTRAERINQREEDHEGGSWHSEKGEDGQLLLHVHRQLMLDGEVVGNLYLYSSTKELAEITSNYAGLGMSGETLMAEQMENGDARFLTALRFDPDAALTRTIAAQRSDVPIIRALSGQTGIHEDVVDYREIPVVAVTAHIPRMNWGLLIKMDQQEVYGAYRQLQLRMLMLLGLIGLSAVIVAYFVAKRISRPLQYLTGVAERIRRGEHTVRANLKSKELDQETTDLALAINGLTDELLQIFNFSPSGMLIADDDGVIILCNQALEEMFGFEEHELIGEPIQTLIPLNDRERYLSGIWSSRDESEKQTRAIDHKLRGLKKCGSEIPIELGFSTIMQYGERKILGTVVDVSDRVRWIREEEIQKEKDDFFASMSHELRTPLTSIIGNSRYLLDDQLSEEQRTIIQSIQDAGKNQLLLVNDILDMSKLESGKFTINEASYNLSHLLKSTCQMLHLRAQDVGLELKLEQESDIKYLLMGDAQRIQQVLINLLGNAIKFTSSGFVRLKSEVINSQLILTVEDSGIGMSPEVMDKVFKRFEQADGTISRRFGGTGLGLYSSLNLTEMMGGELDASSVEGVGSIFQLKLPYLPTTIPVGDAEEQKYLALDQLRFSGEVLVAEDTPLLQQLERRVLEKMGVTVTIVKNGEEAVELASQRPFDLILMDMQMPIMDGIEATARLRGLGNETPIVAVTANVLQKHRDAFYDAGCNGFLGKPIEERSLRTLLKEYLTVELVEYAVSSSTQDEQPSVSVPVFEKSMLDGLPEAVRTSLMEEFYQRIESLSVEFDEVTKRQEWERVHDLAHVVKGAGGSYGCTSLSAKASDVCVAFDSQQFERLPALAQILMEEMRVVLAHQHQKGEAG